VPIILFALLLFVLLALAGVVCAPLLCATAPGRLDGKPGAGIAGLNASLTSFSTVQFRHPFARCEIAARLVLDSTP